ncbi:hypothetical protein AB0L34_30245 [Micromonospora sp. NPDC052213]|uniref:hypothetical protein n=1 Tax=Micromonospora sp. NPDC052213 TaxID=3155812 RepID=UPI003425E7EF
MRLHQRAQPLLGVRPERQHALGGLRHRGGHASGKELGEAVLGQMLRRRPLVAGGVDERLEPLRVHLVVELLAVPAAGAAGAPLHPATE